MSAVAAPRLFGLLWIAKVQEGGVFPVDLRRLLKVSESGHAWSLHAVQASRMTREDHSIGVVWPKARLRSSSSSTAFSDFPGPTSASSNGTAGSGWATGTLLGTSQAKEASDLTAIG